MSLPRILVVGLGGTITMTGAAAGGIVPSLTAADLLAGVPQLAAVAELEAITLFGVPGASLSVPNLVELSRLLREKLAGGFDGAVVVQGTDTIEDTAFVLDLLVDSAVPIVVTGAMRGPQSAGADGPANLLAAVTVAADRRLGGVGVVVVLNDEIHAARWVQKSHTSLPSAFESPGTGRIGIVAEGRADLFMLPRRQAPAVDAEALHACDVALVQLGLGDDGRMLSVLAGMGYAGAVVQGMGAGHVPAAAADAVSALIATMPVVLCTRVPAGRVFTRTYGFAGSEMDLIARGVIPCGHLSASKARLLLTLLLASGAGLAEVRAAFTSPSAGRTSP